MIYLFLLFSISCVENEVHPRKTSNNNNDEMKNPFILNHKLYKIKKDKKWGFCNKEGKIIINPIYLDVQEFSEGLVGAQNSGGKYGYIDDSGNILIEFKYDWVKGFKEGYAYVRHNKKAGYIDKKGNPLTNFIYKSGYSFSEGFACVIKYNDQYGVLDTDKYGFIDTTGSLIIPFIYSANHIIGTLDEPIDYGFKSGLVSVFDPEIQKYGYINKRNEMVISPQYDNVKPFFGNYAIAIMKTEEAYTFREGVIDKTGKWILEPKYYYRTRLQYINKELWITVNNGSKMAVLNEKGKPIIDFKYYNIGPFTEGLASAAASKAGYTKYKYMQGYIDMKGNIVIEPQFYDPGVFINGIAVCAVYDKPNDSFKYGYINKKGEFIIAPQYDYAYDFDANGIAMVQMGEDKYRPDWFGYINTSGEFIWQKDK